MCKSRTRQDILPPPPLHYTSFLFLANLVTVNTLQPSSNPLTYPADKDLQYLISQDTDWSIWRNRGEERGPKHHHLTKKKSLWYPLTKLISFGQPDLFFQDNCQTPNQATEVKTLLNALQIPQKSNQAFY